MKSGEGFRNIHRALHDAYNSNPPKAITVYILENHICKQKRNEIEQILIARRGNLNDPAFQGEGTGDGSLPGTPSGIITTAEDCPAKTKD